MGPAAARTARSNSAIHPSATAKMPRLSTIVEHVIIGQNRQQPVYFNRFWDPASTAGGELSNATS
jgi:hypothetical protein